MQASYLSSSQDLRWDKISFLLRGHELDAAPHPQGQVLQPQPEAEPPSNVGTQLCLVTHHSNLASTPSTMPFGSLNSSIARKHKRYARVRVGSWARQQHPGHADAASSSTSLQGAEKESPDMLFGRAFENYVEVTELSERLRMELHETTVRKLIPNFRAILL